MYNSVKEYFKQEYPDLLLYLDRQGFFWSSVRDNSISNDVLACDYENSCPGGAVYSACHALILGRLVGKIINPNIRALTLFENQTEVEEERAWEEHERQQAEEYTKVLEQSEKEFFHTLEEERNAELCSCGHRSISHYLGESYCTICNCQEFSIFKI